MRPAVLAEGVRVRYGDVHALAGVDLEIEPGSTLGVLGHNGAGKTTLIRVLTTLIRPTAGRALVDGLDVVTEADSVRRRIGVTGQYAGLDEFLTGRENLEMVGRLCGLGSAARGRADDLVARLDLGDIADRRVGTQSGGSRRRIDLAISLVAAPSVLFLDEPTTGLDPAARVALWDVVGELNESGTTVVLTTQYLEEADRLADQIVVLDHGRVAAHGTPSDLKRLVGGKVVTATVPTAELGRLSRRPDETHPTTVLASRISYATDDSGSAAALVAQLAADVECIRTARHHAGLDASTRQRQPGQPRHRRLARRGPRHRHRQRRRDRPAGSDRHVGRRRRGADQPPMSERSTRTWRRREAWRGGVRTRAGSRSRRCAAGSRPAHHGRRR